MSFMINPSDIENMIQTRLEEKSCSEESRSEKEEPWPQEFCLGEWNGPKFRSTPQISIKDLSNSKPFGVPSPVQASQPGAA